MANPLLQQGPVPVALHGVIEYLAGVVFIAAPLVLDFDSGTATGSSVAIGIVVLVVAAFTAGPTGLVTGLPINAHVVLDFVLAIALVVSPFLLGFSDESAPTVFFVTMGIVHLLVTIGTRFETGRRSSATS